MKISNLIISIFIVAGAMFTLSALDANAQTSTYSISGVVFEDINKNEIMESYESLLRSWTVTLSGDKNSTTITEYKGIYSFEGLQPGTYKVCQTTQTYWIQIYPKGDGCHNVTITNSDVTQVNFGVFYNPNAAVLGESTETPTTGTTTTDTGTGGTSSSTTTDGKGEVLGETGAPAWVYALSVGATLMFFIGFIKLTGLKPAREIF